MPLARGVRLVPAPDGQHVHVAGLWTAEGVFFSREDVAFEIEQGIDWWANHDGEREPIRTERQCPYPGCRTSPYLAAVEDLPVDDVGRPPGS